MNFIASKRDWERRLRRKFYLPYFPSPKLISFSFLLFVMLASSNVFASTFTVDSLLDNQSNGCSFGQCTLREAINDANATAGADTIEFQSGLTGTVILTSGQLIISSNLTINGPGAKNLTVSGNNASRVFLIATPLLGGDITVEINGLSVTNGNAVLIGGLAGDGGGILNGALLGVLSGKSTLTLNEVNVSNNLATSLGGGIATRLGAETIINRSLISNNICNPLLPTADVGGGGISNAASTTVISNTTITNNNTLAAGGGILNAAGDLHLTNNTISHNQSTLLGGGVVSLIGTPLPLGITHLRNTIIAENESLFGGNFVSADVLGVLGSFNSLGNNLIGNNWNAEADFEACIFIGATPIPNAKADLVGNIVITNQIIDPLLGNLQDNGGQTNSRLPAVTSPVVNAGQNCVYTNTCAVNPLGKNPMAPLLFDQRGSGSPRLIGANVEIGATELPLAPTSAEVFIGGRIIDVNGQGIYRVQVSLTRPNGTTYTTISNSFGYYGFENLPAGETVVITPQHKLYVFMPQVVRVEEDVRDYDISAFSLNLKSNFSSFRK